MSTTEAPTYPIKQLFPTDGDDSYPELLPAIEFHNQRRYEVALKLFLERPADPGRALKNTICTFHGPIGWLLMFNTRRNKNRFVNRCIASCLCHLGRFKEALGYLEGTTDTQSVYLRAWCESGAGMHEAAKASFKKAIYENPGYLKLPLPYKEEAVL